MVSEPMTIPVIAIPFPVYFSGDFLICESATKPSTRAMIPGTGPKHHDSRIPARPTIIDAIASPWLGPGVRGYTIGGGGGLHAPGLIGGRSSGAIHPPATGGSRGSHIVSCSSGVCTFGARICGSQFGSCAGVSSCMSGVPSSEQKLSHSSLNCLLHCGQYFIPDQTSSKRLKK